MTLIIGFKCTEGVALVSDTKIMDMDTRDSSYDFKILKPLDDTPFIVGAAGYTHLFREFNRKIPDIVSSRLTQFKMTNMQELLKLDFTRDEALEYVNSHGKTASKDIKSVQELSDTKKNEQQLPNFDGIPLPHAYTAELFIDDCKSLLRGMSERESEDYDPIDALIALKKPNTDESSLHHINASGQEEEITDYYAIGSGKPYVRMFFDRVYDYDLNFADLVPLAYKSIIFASTIAKENSVGYSEEYPPQPVVVLNNGVVGSPPIKEHWKLIRSLEDEIKSFGDLIKNN